MVFRQKGVEDWPHGTARQVGLVAEKNRGFRKPRRHHTDQGRDGAAGKTRLSVRLDEQRWDIFERRFDHRRASQVAACPYHHLRLKIPQHHRRFYRASRQNHEVLNPPPAADAFQTLGLDGV